MWIISIWYFFNEKLCVFSGHCLLEFGFVGHIILHLLVKDFTHFHVTHSIDSYWVSSVYFKNFERADGQGESLKRETVVP